MRRGFTGAGLDHRKTCQFIEESGASEQLQEPDIQSAESRLPFRPLFCFAIYRPPTSEVLWKLHSSLHRWNIICQWKVFLRVHNKYWLLVEPTSAPWAAYGRLSVNNQKSFKDIFSFTSTSLQQPILCVNDWPRLTRLLTVFPGAQLGNLACKPWEHLRFQSRSQTLGRSSFPIHCGHCIVPSNTV